MNEIKGIIEFIWDKFELFVRRAILPSSVLVSALFLVDYITDKSLLVKLYEFFIDKPFIIILICSIIFLFSISYIMKFLSQFIFDNLIKVNYDHVFFWDIKENEGFKFLRTQVLKKLSDDNVIDISSIKENDYILYQVLENLLNLNTDMQRYSTDVKEVGISIISIIIAIIYYISIVKTYWLLISIPILLYIGYVYSKTKYRSRAYRMYVNYLINK